MEFSQKRCEVEIATGTNRIEVLRMKTSNGSERAAIFAELLLNNKPQMRVFGRN
jgi:hypothetical protein